MYGMKKPAKAKMIKGPGTGTSDSIQTSVPEGTFMMPADSSAALGFKPDQVDINASNGEIAFPPETLQALGAQLLRQFKEGTHQDSGKPQVRMKDGEPQHFFEDGDEVWRPGMLSPSQVEQQRRQQARQAMAQRITQDRQRVGDAVGGAARAGGALAVDVMTGGPVRRFAENSTIDTRLPGQDTRDRLRQRSMDAANPNWREQAQGFAQRVSGNALAAGLQPMRDATPDTMRLSDVLRPGAPAAARSGGAPDLLDASQAGNLSQQSQANPQPAQRQQQTQQQVDPMTRSAQAPSTQEGQWRRSGNIAGRMNADGVAEFSNRGADLQAAGDNVLSGQGFESQGQRQVMRGGTGRPTDTPQGSMDNVGNGVGGFSVLGGGQEAMRRNEMASAIRAQTRLENSNPNYVSVIRDSGRGGVQGERNRRANDLDAEARGFRSDRRRQEIAEGAQNLTAMRQNLSQERQAEQQAQMMRSLQQRMGDPAATAEEREAARRAYMDMTVSPRDRYMRLDQPESFDENGMPTGGGQVVIDLATGQLVSAQSQQPQQATTTLTMDQVRQIARRDGRTPNEVIAAAEIAGHRVER